jgi:hypothetical protein
MELDYIKAKDSGLWLYDIRGIVILILESKDLDNVETAIKECRKLAGSSDFRIIPMKPQEA